MAEYILEVRHLKKNFISGKKSFTAVEDVSFFLKQGAADYFRLLTRSHEAGVSPSGPPTFQ